MAGRHYHLSSGNIFLTWLIAGIVVLLLPASVTNKVYFAFLNTFKPVISLGQKVQSAPIPVPTEGEVTREEYDKLRKSYQNLYAQMLQMHEDYEKLTQLRAALPKPFSELMPARVVGSVNSFSHEIIINKGSEAGINPGNYVLSAGQNSIIGIVDQTAQQLSKVLLLTDSRQKIPIQIHRVGEGINIGGLMVGNGKNACKISNIKRDQTVEVGDTVFARPHPGLLNTPVIIGEVLRVDPDDKHPLLWDITVKPIEDMARLEDVAVIIVEDF